MYLKIYHGQLWRNSKLQNDLHHIKLCQPNNKNGIRNYYTYLTAILINQKKINTHFYYIIRITEIKKNTIKKRT